MISCICICFRLTKTLFHISWISHDCKAMVLAKRIIFSHPYSPYRAIVFYLTVNVQLLQIQFHTCSGCTHMHRSNPWKVWFKGIWMSIDNGEMKWRRGWGGSRGFALYTVRTQRLVQSDGAGWHQQIKGCLYLYLTATQFFYYLPCGLLILTHVFMCAYAHFNTFCIMWGLFLPGEYRYLAHTPTHAERDTVQEWQVLNQAPCLFWFTFSSHCYNFTVKVEHWFNLIVCQSSPSTPTCPMGQYNPAQRPF